MACTNEISRDKVSSSLRITIAFQEVAPFIRANRSIPCRMKCAICRDPWGKTATASVHVLFWKLKQFYICDSCLEIPELEGIERREATKKEQSNDER